MRILGCVVNAQLKQMIHRNSLLIILECPRMFGLGRQMRCIALEISEDYGGVLLYCKNGFSGGRRRGLIEPAAAIQRRTGIPPGASPNAYRWDHRGGGVLHSREGVWQQTGRREGRERVHCGWKGCYECLRPQARNACNVRRSTHDAGLKVHSNKVKEMETDRLSCRA
ncbi:hypothetical protein B0H14DRAFT_2757598, partial [Mycena olivaceomarginata]